MSQETLYIHIHRVIHHVVHSLQHLIPEIIPSRKYHIHQSQFSRVTGPLMFAVMHVVMCLSI
jgi:hypothetical protein